MRKITALIFSCLLLAFVTNNTFSQTDLEVNCARLSEDDCQVYRGASQNVFTSAEHPVLNIRVDANGQQFDYVGTGVSQFENGDWVALDWDFPNNMHIITVDGVSYASFADAPDEWLIEEDMGDTGILEDALLDTLPFFEMERGADQALDGQVMAVFSSEADPLTFMSQPAFIQMMAGIAGLEPADMQTNLPLLVEFMEPKTFYAEAWVGQDDNLLHYMHTNVEMGVAIPEAVSDLGYIYFRMEIEMQFANHNAPVEIAAPEGNLIAYDLPFFSLDTTMASYMGLNSRSDAAISYGDVLSLATDAESQRHNVSFEAAVGDIVTITAQATDPTSNLDLTLRLVSSVGEEIAISLNQSGSDVTLGTSDTRITSFTISEAGTYQIVVSWPPVEDDIDFELSLLKE